ncbi:unnamed protein product [[Actinomadura] parvosata subsp. kistnae]|nr:unnamed protein product [Actinomadura parvosata subsp. kistnae]
MLHASDDYSSITINHCKLPSPDAARHPASRRPRCALLCALLHRS